LAAAVVGSALKARFGDSCASPPRLRPKSLAAEPLLFSKHALRFSAQANDCGYCLKQHGENNGDSQREKNAINPHRSHQFPFWTSVPVEAKKDLTGGTSGTA
jgi:hypothetical protein